MKVSDDVLIASCEYRVDAAISGFKPNASSRNLYVAENVDVKRPKRDWPNVHQSQRVYDFHENRAAVGRRWV